MHQFPLPVLDQFKVDLLGRNCGQFLTVLSSQDAQQTAGGSLACLSSFHLFQFVTSTAFLTIYDMCQSKHLFILVLSQTGCISSEVLRVSCLWEIVNLLKTGLKRRIDQLLSACARLFGGLFQFRQERVRGTQRGPVLMGLDAN